MNGVSGVAVKKSAIVFLLLACLPFGFAQKTRFGQEPPKARPGTLYPIKLYVSGIRLREDCYSGTCVQIVHAESVLDQKKVELTGDLIYQPGFYRFDILPGDYTARLLKQSRDAPGGMISNEYEVLLPDQVVWCCTVTGIFE
jgi:hypothetical protein